MSLLSLRKVSNQFGSEISTQKLSVNRLRQVSKESRGYLSEGLSKTDFIVGADSPGIVIVASIRTAPLYGSSGLKTAPCPVESIT